MGRRRWPLAPHDSACTAAQNGAPPGSGLMLGEVLRLEDVACTCDGRVVVDRVSVTIAAGTLNVVRGGRGSGKSVLMSVAAAARRPGAGSVFIAGRDILALQQTSLPFVRRNIGYLPADPPLIGDESALENVMLALAVRGDAIAAAEEAASAALADVGLPENLLPVATKRLSDTERRLVALARAVVGAPPLVVLDEPTAGLAPGDRRVVVHLLAALRTQRVAVLCATADMTLADELEAAGADVLDLHNGRLVGEPRMTVLRGRTTPAPLESASDVHAADDDAADVDDAQELDPEDVMLVDDVREARR